MPFRLTIFQKGLLLLVVPLLSQLAFAGLVYWYERETTEAQRWVIHSKDVINETQDVSRGLLELESSSRGYIFTGDSSFARPIDESVTAAQKAMARLLVLVADNDAQEEKARQLAAGADDFIAWHAVNHCLVRCGEQDKAIARLRAGGGRLRMDALRHQLASFLGEEEHLDRARTATLDATRQQLRHLLLLATSLAAIVTGLLTVAFHRGISGRLATLTENAQRLARGVELVPPLRGSDEIYQLDRAFHTTAGELARSQQALRTLNTDLERRVAARTAELAEANRDLTEKNRENEMFVYSVSHDLRSPLVNLQGFSKELELIGRDLRGALTDPGVPAEVRRRGEGLLDGDMAESLRFIQSGVMRLSGIIDALLRLSRAGRVEYQWQQVDVQGVVRRVVESLRATAVEHGATVEVRPLPPVWGDPNALERVFANLIGNALNYLDRSRPGQVEVGFATPSGAEEPAYFVRDNGLGIASDYQQKVFQAFQRAHGDHTPGEGIGLTIVRRVVERHRGRVWVESEVGRGSTFWVALPRGRGEGGCP